MLFKFIYQTQESHTHLGMAFFILYINLKV